MERGQKSECESLAVAIRAELGLDTLARLDPRLLAAHFEIEVHPVSALKGDGAVQAAVRHVREENSKMFSAMTIFPDWPQRRRVIIFNDANSEARQNSDITHELGHGLRLHEPRHAIVNGCRDYSKAEEDEASWLAGCLLVPRAAAVAVAYAGEPLDLAAARYGVSLEMMRMRVHRTGAQRQADAARRRRAG